MNAGEFLAAHWPSLAVAVVVGPVMFAVARHTSPARVARRRAVATAAAERANTTCTGVSASWCPVHGDCRCPEPADPHERRDLNHPGCPLHAVTSAHAERTGPA